MEPLTAALVLGIDRDAALDEAREQHGLRSAEMRAEIAAHTWAPTDWFDERLAHLDEALRVFERAAEEDRAEVRNSEEPAGPRHEAAQTLGLDVGASPTDVRHRAQELLNDLQIRCDYAPTHMGATWFTRGKRQSDAAARLLGGGETACNEFPPATLVPEQRTEPDVAAARESTPQDARDERLAEAQRPAQPSRPATPPGAATVLWRTLTNALRRR